MIVGGSREIDGIFAAYRSWEQSEISKSHGSAAKGWVDDALPSSELSRRRMLLTREEEAQLLKVTYASSMFATKSSIGPRLFNPFVWTRGRTMTNILVNYAWSQAGNPLSVAVTNSSPATSLDGFPGILPTKVAWIEVPAGGSARLRGFIPDGSDARAVVVDGVPYAFFSRHRARKLKDTWVATLRGEPPWPEVQLSPHGLQTVGRRDHGRPSEGNWLPFVHGGRVWMSYELCPEHIVLSVNTTSGNCTPAFATPAPGCSGGQHPWLAHRGSASGFPLERRDHAAVAESRSQRVVLGLGHGKGYIKGSNIYWHFFFLRAAAPPFRILARSAGFRLDDRLDDHVFQRRHHDDHVFQRRHHDHIQYHIQFCLSLRRAGGGEGLMTFDYGVEDAAALTVNISRAAYCNFTGWCANDAAALRHVGGVPTNGEALAPVARSSAERVALAVLSSTASAADATPTHPGSRSPHSPEDAAPEISYAIVIKGPLLAFTRDVVAYYLRQHRDAAVVFSHHNGTCGSDGATVRLLQHMATDKHGARFAYEIGHALAVPGQGYRNAQREAWYYGIRRALALWGAGGGERGGGLRYVFLQRSDSAFQEPSMLHNLHALAAAQPPPAVPIPGGRVGLCGIQIVLSNVYGRFHLDDHCAFGTPLALLHYWNVKNPLYNRTRISSTGPPSNTRRHCRWPAAESEAGFLWVMQDALQRAIPVPASTRDLLHQRAWVIDPWALGHVCRRKRGDRRLTLPLAAPAQYNILNEAVVNASAPLSALRLCSRAGGQFDCSALADSVANRTDSPRWACAASNTRC